MAGKAPSSYGIFSVGWAADRFALSRRRTDGRWNAQRFGDQARRAALASPSCGTVRTLNSAIGEAIDPADFVAVAFGRQAHQQQQIVAAQRPGNLH
jgi:hypothetical protein